MTDRRVWVAAIVVAAFAAHVGSLRNGFAYDDEPIVSENPIVTEGRWGEAVARPYWNVTVDDGLLWRPVSTVGFTAQWALFDGRPAGFHALNLVLTAGVGVLVFLLLLRLGSPAAYGRAPPTDDLVGPVAAGLAALLFVVHPVHVEAVANVVGQAELWAALFGLTALLLALDDTRAPGVRLVGASLAYALALGGKEIAITVPALLWLVRTFERGGRPLVALRRDLPVHLCWVAVAAAYLVLRAWVLGGLIGEDPAPPFIGEPAGTRLWTAFSVLPIAWGLMVAPVHLSADYDPGYLSVVSPPEPAGLLGIGVWIALAALAVAGWRRGGHARLAAVGLLWVELVRLPVSNLVIVSGVLLAERTLFLPSVGIALLVASGIGAARASGRDRPETRGAAVDRGRVAVAAAVLVAVLFAVRSAARVPVWDSTATVTASLLDDAPTSWRAMRLYAIGLIDLGREEEGVRILEEAWRTLPGRQDLTTEIGGRLTGLGHRERARTYLETAVRRWPNRIDGYNLLVELELLEGRYRAAVDAAAAGIGAADPNARTWGTMSEAWIGLGRLEAAIRARRASLAHDPGDASGRARLRELEAAWAAVQAARAGDPPPIDGGTDTGGGER